MTSVRTPTPLGTYGTARSGAEPKMRRPQAWRGRAGQAFALREPGVKDGTTADSLVVDRHAPNRMARLASRSSSQGAACGFWSRASGPTRAD